ncbi:hypothetical protein RUND412_002714 [Rhizina undulata]
MLRQPSRKNGCSSPNRALPVRRFAPRKLSESEKDRGCWSAGGGKCDIDMDTRSRADNKLCSSGRMGGKVGSWEKILWIANYGRDGIDYWDGFELDDGSDEDRMLM